jgi:hypothetical protein
VTITTKQASAAIELIKLAYTAVASSGEAGMPSGHLYALLMPAFDSLAGYESMIDLMLRTKLLSKRGQVLVAAKIDGQEAK